MPCAQSDSTSTAIIRRRLSDGVTPAARLQNRTGGFPLIRLLELMTFVIRTRETSRFVIALLPAIAVEKQKVVVRIAPTCVRDNALYAHCLSVAKVLSALDATAPLFLQESCNFCRNIRTPS